MPHPARTTTLGVFAFAMLSLFAGGDITNAADPVVVVSEGAIPGLRQPQAAISNTGNINVTFGAGKTIYFCKSTVSPLQRRLARFQNWPWECDIAADSNGHLLTVWRHDRSIYSAGHGLQPQKFLGLGEQPSIVATSDGYFISWVDRRGVELLLLRPPSSNTVTVATKASDPVLAATITGAGPIVLVWESKEGDVSSIRSEVVND